MIWLKNILPYRLAAAELAAEAITTALAAKPFITPGANDLYSQGWIAPASHITAQLMQIKHEMNKAWRPE